MTARNFSRLPSELFGIEDSAVAMAFDVAATLALFDNDQQLAQAAEARQMQVMAAMMTGGLPESQIKWDSVETF